jgi:nitroreductase
MDFFDVVTTQRAMRRPQPDATSRSTSCDGSWTPRSARPSGGNRQNWSFVVVRDPAKRARLGELYREAWGELMKVPYYASASKEPASSPAGKMLASARHLGEHLGEAPVIVLACVALDPA